MLKYVLRPLVNSKSSYNGRYYAYPAIEETVDLKALAKHMANHHSGFSEAVCYAVVQSMVRCIKEMVLEGKNVKIDDLAIFSCGIVNVTGGATSAAEFTTPKHIRRVKLRARATGELSNTSLNLDATLRKAYYTTNGTVAVLPDDTPSGGGGSDSSGSGSGSGESDPL